MLLNLVGFYLMMKNSNSFEILEQFRFLETIVMDYNSIYEEIRSGLRSQNASYYSAHNLR